MKNDGGILCSLGGSLCDWSVKEDWDLRSQGTLGIYTIKEL